MAGVPGLSGNAMAGLKSALASQSAPPNPATPKDRTDPDESLLLDFQRVRRALDVAREHLPEGDPRTLLVSAVGACFTRLLSHIELTDAVDILLERAFPLSSSQLKQRLQAMFAPPPPPISPPTGLGGGAQRPGMPPVANQGPAGGITGQPPGGPPAGEPSGDAGVATLPA